MDPKTPLDPGDGGTRCCACSSGCSAEWFRSVKRKLDQMEDDSRRAHQTDVARVEIENEVAALRETLGRQQQTIQELYSELEEERNAASSAANEAMSMILRLQREKAEVQMEARQFKRFAEEKIAHDQQELLAFEDVLFKRDQAVQSLSCEVQAYKHRLMSYGINAEDDLDLSAYDYPPLRCTAPTDLDLNDNVADFEKYPFGETPRTREHLQNLEDRIYQLERNPSSNHGNVMEKGVVGQSPRCRRHFRSFSTDSYGSGKESKREDEFPVTVDRASSDDGGGDEMSDRVYTIDAVHVAPVDNVSTPRELGKGEDGGGEEEEGDVKKLYMRLQALEADRESMRQALISMRTDKAQLVLLREIAQHLCKEVTPPERKVVKKPSLIGSFSIVSIVKWIVSFVFWKKKAHRSKYSYGLSSNNVGLLLLLDKSPRMRQWRCLTRTQG